MKQLLALTLLLVAFISSADPAGKPVWIDVRSPDEFESGHLAGAQHIPYDAIEAGIVLLELEKDTPIYLYCRGGRRAQIAKERLEHRGYTRVVNAGGLEEARALAASQAR